jgi:probable phosphomutase (TIGR03848 family)
LILIRHGRSQANAAGVLAGRTAGVALDDTGVRQADALAERFAHVSFERIVTSPLERCRATAVTLANGRTEPIIDERLVECDYGEWTGRKLEELHDEPLWADVQDRPSGVTFPGGESMTELWARAIAAVTEHNAAVDENAAWAAVAHADVIKAIIADAAGLGLDHFQRFVVDPGSLSAVHYGKDRTAIWKLNDTGIERLRASPFGAREPEIAVGGGAGTT